MALEAVPLLKEDSRLCWDIESTFKTAPATNPWQSLGRVEDWTDLGPTKQIFREAIAGSGRQAATIGVGATTYPQTTIGPFQVVNPRFLGFFWGQEQVPLAIGGGYYRHTAQPTTNGRLPSMALQAADYKNGTRIDGSTYLGVIMPKLSLRGEPVGEDGSGGRVMAAPSLLPHDDSIAVDAKTMTLDESLEPYRFHHSTIKFFNSDVDWRIHSWEFTGDNHATTNFYHATTNGNKPTESPPEGITYDLRMDIIADGHANVTSNKMIRDLVRDEVLGQAEIKMVRTANQDEWQLNLTDLRIATAPKVRRRGKIHYEVEAVVRQTTLQWVDANSSRYFPA